MDHHPTSHDHDAVHDQTTMAANSSSSSSGSSNSSTSTTNIAENRSNIGGSRTADPAAAILGSSGSISADNDNIVTIDGSILMPDHGGSEPQYGANIVADSSNHAIISRDLSWRSCNNNNSYIVDIDHMDDDDSSSTWYWHSMLTMMQQQQQSESQIDRVSMMHGGDGGNMIRANYVGTDIVDDSVNRAPAQYDPKLITGSGPSCISNLDFHQLRSTMIGHGAGADRSAAAVATNNTTSAWSDDGFLQPAASAAALGISGVQLQLEVQQQQQQRQDDQDMYGPIIMKLAADDDDKLKLLSSPDQHRGALYDQQQLLSPPDQHRGAAHDQEQLLSSPGQHRSAAYDQQQLLSSSDQHQQHHHHHRMIMMHDSHADPGSKVRGSSYSGWQYSSSNSRSSTDIIPPAKRDQSVDAAMYRYSYNLIDRDANFGGGSVAADDPQWQYVKQHEQLFTNNVDNIIIAPDHELYPDHHHPPHIINAALITSTTATASVNAAVDHAANYSTADPPPPHHLHHQQHHGDDNYAPLSSRAHNALFMINSNAPDHHRLMLSEPAHADHYPALHSVDHHVLHLTQLYPLTQYPQLLAPAAHNLPHPAADPSTINAGLYIGFDPAFLSTANHVDHHQHHHHHQQQQQQQQQLMMINDAARNVNRINHDQPPHINHHHHHRRRNHEISASSSMNINSSQYAKKNSAQFGLYNKLAAHGPANQKAPPGSLQPATAKPARSMLRSADDQGSGGSEEAELEGKEMAEGIKLAAISSSAMIPAAAGDDQKQQLSADHQEYSFKRPRVVLMQQQQSSPSPSPANAAAASNSKSLQAPVRKEKLTERITTLQQLVSPFGKTDTASVLLEAIGYIKFLQDKVEALNSTYFRSGSNPAAPAPGSDHRDLRSRGLCLVPLSCTMQVSNADSGADYWYGGSTSSFR